MGDTRAVLRALAAGPCSHQESRGRRVWGRETHCCRSQNCRRSPGDRRVRDGEARAQEQPGELPGVQASQAAEAGSQRRPELSPKPKLTRVSE